MELFHSLQPPSEDCPSSAGGDRVCLGREMDTGLLRVDTWGEPALPGVGRTSHCPLVTLPKCSAKCGPPLPTQEETEVQRGSETHPRSCSY